MQLATGNWQLAGLKFRHLLCRIMPYVDYVVVRSAVLLCWMLR
jgi:hypothetical protein